MRAKSLFSLLLVCVLFVGVTFAASAKNEPPPTKVETSETGVITVDGADVPNVTPSGQISYSPTGQSFQNEVEPNETTAQANALASSPVTVMGNIYPNADEDYFSFTANAGDRLYAAIMTSFSANGSSDSQLYLYDVDGTTQLEFDDDDGSMGGLSSSIAGKVLPTTGTYFLRVKHFSATNQLRPYYLHVRVQTGTPTAEVEPNDTPATANVLPTNGWVSGARDPALATEQDWYSFSANAGDTVFLSLDLDPERDAVMWNGRLGIGLFGDAGNQILVVDDAGTGSGTNPLSEAMFMTVKNAGTYFAFVDSATAGTGGPTATYNLSVTIFPAVAEGPSCTTYTSTDAPIIIGPGAGLVSSTIVVPGNPRIGDLNVSIQLDHTLMGDLDVHLRSPQGNDNGLFTDIGASVTGGQTIMDATFDDEAGVTPLYTVLNGLVIKPELAYRLSWFDGEDAGGTWTLDIRDDGANASGGNLTGWSITICDPAPPPVCPPGTTQSTLYSSDFEADAGGFTHSGTLDEWELGLPSFVPITTCNSGVNCWVTDLDNTYEASSSQNLLSPNISLVGTYTQAWVTWSQRNQLETASFDHATATVQQVGGASPRTLWQWLDATQTNAVGNPSVTIQESSGWGQFNADISEYIGQNIELVYHLDSDTSGQYTGYAVDDVSVNVCAPVPSITLEKTVGTNPATCAVTNNIAVAPGTDVTYCYTVENTGLVTLTQHDLEDNELGVILNDFPYSLGPGASAFITETVNITTSVVNTATWTAFNPGPIDVVTATSTATVTVAGGPEPLVCNATPVMFESGIPTDWTVVDNTGGTGIVWTTTADTANCGIANLTNGSGEAACADSDNAGSGAPPYDTELVSNAFDLTGYNSITLATAAYYNDLGTGNDLLTVDLWDGATWTNLLTWDADHMPGDISLDLSAYAGQTGLQIRYRYAGNGWDWYAEVDDISLTCANVSNPPIIDVAPTSLESSQQTNTVVTQTLTIGNLGEADLSWWIDEDNDTSLVRLTSAPNRGAVAGTPVSSYTLSNKEGRTLPAPRGATVVLYDQTDNPGTNGFPSQNFEAANDAYDNAGADDFVVPVADGTWNITSLDILGSYSAAGPIPTVDVTIYADNAGLPGTIVYSALGVVPTTDVAGDLTIDLPTLASLPAGQYWVSVVANMDYGVGGQWFWSTRAIQSNNPYAWQNPGDGFASGCTSWAYGATGCGVGGGVDPDALFRLNGFIGEPPACLIPSDVPWASVSPITGTVAGGASQDVTVSFDSTGLTPGTYTGNLCVNSDDPVTPMVTVPLTLTVEGEVGPALVEIAHLAPFAASAAVTVTVDGVPVLTDFDFADSTGYLELPAGEYDLAVYPAGSPTPAITGTVTLEGDTAYSAMAIGDGSNQPLEIIVLTDDLAAPPAGFAKVAIAHLAPFASTLISTTVDVRLQDGTLLLDDLPYGFGTNYTNLPAGTYDLKITSPDGTTTLIDPLPVILTDGEIIQVLAVGDGVNQPLGIFAWPNDTVGALLPLAEYGVTLSVDQSVTGAPGETVTYEVTITNSGNVTDTFDLASVGTWAAALSDTSITLGAGQSTTFTVEVTIPVDAVNDDSDVTTVVATSQGDSFAADSVDLTTTAVVEEPEGTFIYLPTVTR